MIISRPGKKKYATTVNDTLDERAFIFLNSFQDDTSDSSKQVETSMEPIKYTQTINIQSQMILTLSTYVVIYKMEPLIWTQSSLELESLDKEDLGILAGEAYPKELFRGGKV